MIPKPEANVRSLSISKQKVGAKKVYFPLLLGFNYHPYIFVPQNNVSWNDIATY